MKYLLAFAICTAIAQFTIVPSFKTAPVAQQLRAHQQAIEEAGQ